MRARTDLARNAGQPDSATAAIAAALRFVHRIAGAAVGPTRCAPRLQRPRARLGMALLAKRQIGGQTGDVLGGAEQVGETAILVLLAARLGTRMSAETNLWLIRHAPVDGPRGVIHAPDAPADLGDAAAFAALKARLPANAFAVCSPARRTRETAATLGLDPVENAAFREQDFGALDRAAARRSHQPSSATPITDSGNRRPATAARRRKLCRSDRARSGRTARLPAGDVVLVVHSGTIRAVLAIALDLAPDSALRFVIDPLSLTQDRSPRGRLARRSRSTSADWTLVPQIAALPHG